MHDILHDVDAGRVGLTKLKDAFEVFASNQQTYPLIYDLTWGGIVSSAAHETGQLFADFGNSCYNDHHFHYSYFIYTAAVIGLLEPSWIPENKPFVNALVRDIANPSEEDKHFPVSRTFDWYHGHSWAHGLTEAPDGKDQESSSEDALSAYALRMWGKVIGDSDMAARGTLQLCVTARSLQKYYLYTNDNETAPMRILGNKVAGVLFENKIDHTTYFGSRIEYVQGIHMLPLLPYAALTRSSKFVEEEWLTFFSHGRVDSIAGGWRGILYGNLAIIDPKAAWKFFGQPNFDMSWLDGGASRTWYMVFAASMAHYILSLDDYANSAILVLGGAS
jgi:endo-1,3(4)-beta-glucanase